MKIIELGVIFFNKKVKIHDFITMKHYSVTYPPIINVIISFV